MLAPLRPLVAGSARRHLPDEPLDDRAADRPGVGLERRHGHRRQFDRVRDAGSGVGEGELAPFGVGIVHLRAHQRLEPVDGLGHDEGVLHERAHVVVDVDDGGQVVAVGQTHGQVDVVAVAEHVDHLDRPVHVGLAEPGEPLRQPIAPLRQLPPDAHGHEVVVGELGDHGQQGRRLDAVDVEEHRDELLEGVRRVTLGDEPTRTHGGRRA